MISFPGNPDAGSRHARPPFTACGGLQR